MEKEQKRDCHNCRFHNGQNNSGNRVYSKVRIFEENSLLPALQLVRPELLGGLITTVVLLTGSGRVGCRVADA
jgi:hypothetical protein